MGFISAIIHKIAKYYIEESYMKKNIFILLLAIMLSCCSFTVFAATDPPEITGDSVVVMDASTGEVVYGKSENDQYPPASTTKLMTILLTLENCDLNEVVTVGDYPPTIEGSKIYIGTGEQLTVEQMLYSVIMVSANDCAAALAEHISGSVEAFAELMNSRAKELGCLNTHFCNPHGLYEDEHRTTTYDLALIEKELLKYPKYIEISQTKSSSIEPTNTFTETRPLWNDNRLLHEYYNCYYPAALAGKTGYTDESLHSYVASAKKGDSTFIIAILHDKYKAYYNEVPGLFDWAFENFGTEKAFSNGEEIGIYTTSNGTEIPLIAKEDLSYTKDLTTDSTVSVNINTSAIDGKFFSTGDVITTADVTYGDQSYTIDVLSGSDYYQETIPVLGNLLTTEENTINYKSLWIIIGCIAAAVIIFILLLIRLIKIRILAKKRNKIWNSYYGNNKHKY